MRGPARGPKISVAFRVHGYTKWFKKIGPRIMFLPVSRGSTYRLVSANNRRGESARDAGDNPPIEIWPSGWIANGEFKNVSTTFGVDRPVFDVHQHIASDNGVRGAGVRAGRRSGRDRAEACRRRPDCSDCDHGF